MSLATTLEHVDHERTSMQPDEWLDYLIQLRDAIEARVYKEHYSPKPLPREPLPSDETASELLVSMYESMKRTLEVHPHAPTEPESEHELFEPIWQVIKDWDIGKWDSEICLRMYSGASGDDVRAILAAILRYGDERAGK